jgi:hypothetical protein
MAEDLVGEGEWVLKKIKEVSKKKKPNARNIRFLRFKSVQILILKE